jgi:hypothetical protein
MLYPTTLMVEFKYPCYVDTTPNEQTEFLGTRNHARINEKENPLPASHLECMYARFVI